MDAGGRRAWHRDAGPRVDANSLPARGCRGVDARDLSRAAGVGTDARADCARHRTAAALRGGWRGRTSGRAAAGRAARFADAWLASADAFVAAPGGLVQDAARQTRRPTHA